MKVINLDRGKGKTTRLLYASEFNDIPILCSTAKQRDYLLDMAKRWELKIPKPIIVSDIVENTGKLRGSHITDKGILIDDVDLVLQCLLSSLGVKGEIKAIALTGDREKYTYDYN